MKRIDVLPDDILLGIFDFYMTINPSLFGSKQGVEVWQALIHVCRRWRSLVLGSPRHLRLRLCCTPKTPAKYTVDVWPVLPLIITGDMTLSGTDNIVAALGQNNCVREVLLRGLVGWQLENLLAAMHVPFPELAELRLYSNINDETLPVIPDSFLGGSAPRLRVFSLTGIPFPGLPKLLLSVDRLLSLDLLNVPHSGYISPETMVSLLSVLSGLRRLSLKFKSPQSHPDWESQSLPPPKRAVLPALDEFHFQGVTEYLEELATRIDTPQLKRLCIMFFNQIDFDTLRLAQFINRTPTFRALDGAYVQFDRSTVSVKLRYRTSNFIFGPLEISISCREPDWQLSSIEQVCNSSLRHLSTVEDLYIDRRYVPLDWKNGAIENSLWLQLLLAFPAVKNLYLSKEVAPGIAAALRELAEVRTTEVLPRLEDMFVEELEPSGPLHKDFGQFVAARSLSDHPITISVWDKR